jgi:4-hydroxybenzoate polyprenyltransferase
MLKDIIASLRPKQWLKNGFILAALVFDRQLTNLVGVKHTLIGIVIFCFLSSSVYVINDIFDIKADQKHPVKKNRPIASGRISVHGAILLAVVLAVGSLIWASLLNTNFFYICTFYLAMNLAYSNGSSMYRSWT